MTDEMPAERVAPRKGVLPLLPPTVPSGRAVLGGQCSHSAPDDCPECNGQRGEEREQWRAQRDRQRARRPLTRDEMERLIAANRAALKEAL